MSVTSRIKCRNSERLTNCIINARGEDIWVNVAGILNKQIENMYLNIG